MNVCKAFSILSLSSSPNSLHVDVERGERRGEEKGGWKGEIKGGMEAGKWKGRKERDWSKRGNGEGGGGRILGRRDAVSRKE
jgi:hypothetical protein